MLKQHHSNKNENNAPQSNIATKPKIIIIIKIKAKIKVKIKIRLKLGLKLKSISELKQHPLN